MSKQKNDYRLSFFCLDIHVLFSFDSMSGTPDPTGKNIYGLSWDGLDRSY